MGVGARKGRLRCSIAVRTSLHSPPSSLLACVCSTFSLSTLSHHFAPARLPLARSQPPFTGSLTMKSFQALIAAACIANVNAHMMMVCSATSCNTVSTLFMYRSRSRSIRTTRLCSRPPSPSSFLAWSRHGLPRLVPQQPEQRHRIDARWCPHDQDARRPRVRFHFRKYARRSSALSFYTLSLTHSPLALISRTPTSVCNLRDGHIARWHQLLRGGRRGHEGPEHAELVHIARRSQSRREGQGGRIAASQPLHSSELHTSRALLSLVSPQPILPRLAPS